MHYRRMAWMSDDQYEAYRMLADLFGGDHHLTNVRPFGIGIEMNHRGELATFDYNLLSRAVFMAHDRSIRFAVSSSGPGMIKLILHKRHMREGNMCQRHPTLAKAIAQYKVS